jgi:hypothetical protein
MSRLIRWLVGRKPSYRPGDYYKFYSQFNFNLAAGQLVYRF